MMAKFKYLLVVVCISFSVSAHAASLEIERPGESVRVMPCLEWAALVQSMADTGMERFFVLAREYVQQTKWPFVELAGYFIAAHYLDGSNAAGVMAFTECRGIP